MAIYPPGKRDRRHRLRSSGARDTVASLSLTAMVDMFTVLVIFLLANYKETDEILYIPKEIILPEASETRELKPAHVVTISSKVLMMDEDIVTDFDQVKNQRNWMIRPLYSTLLKAFKQDEVEHKKKLRTRLKSVVEKSDAKGKAVDDDSRRKVTVQADREIDFLTIKKIMFTVTEAGASEINFAVISVPKPEEFKEITN